MVQDLHSQKNVLQSTVSLSKPKQPASPQERTPLLSDIRSPDVPAPETPAPSAPILALGPALASINKLFKQFIKAYLEARIPALV